MEQDRIVRDDRPFEQVAVLAVRHRGTLDELCLIRRHDAARWGIPKGFVDSGMTPEEAAVQEAWEEAGIRGDLVIPGVGAYTYEKRRSILTVKVYVMRVTAVSATWPEMQFRERRWSAIREAVSELAQHPVAGVLKIHIAAEGM
jgi:8-oxo-dGTP pyrophosphatase MutT (NUDIX family)